MTCTCGHTYPPATDTEPTAWPADVGWFDLGCA